MTRLHQVLCSKDLTNAGKTENNQERNNYLQADPTQAHGKTGRQAAF